MAEDFKKQAKLTVKDITELKYFDQMTPLLQRLHHQACDRDTARNRLLHYHGLIRAVAQLTIPEPPEDYSAFMQVHDEIRQTVHLWCFGVLSLILLFHPF